MRIFSCVWIILLSLLVNIGIAQENDVLNTIQNKRLKEFPLTQHLFLHLDRTKFSVPDTIWFKGYSIHGPLHQASNVSQTITVALLNSKNELVHSSQFLVFDGVAEGQIALSDFLKEGFYQMVAYGSNMLNQDCSSFFRTTIELVSEKRESYNFDFRFNKRYYSLNDEVDLKVLIYNDHYKPRIKELLNYELLGEEETLDKGKIRTNTEGIAELKFPFRPEYQSEDVLKVILTAGLVQSPFTGISYIKPLASALDVQMLPEGGTLVDGLLQAVAFRSVDSKGEPVNISGDIINANGEVIANFSAMHDGMGKFSIVPDKSETYSLRIKTPEIFKREIPLPGVSDHGYALTMLGERNGDVFFKLAKNFEGPEMVTAVWQMGGLIVDVKLIELQQEIMVHFSKRNLPEGIAKLTLFDHLGEPFAERLVYIQSEDDVKFDVDLPQPSFSLRRPYNLKMKLQTSDDEPVDANLSLTITHLYDGLSADIPIPDIRDHAFFKTELSGAVYKPSQYFIKPAGDVVNQQHLDLVMLTHGWRKFDWYSDMKNKADTSYRFFNYDLFRGLVTKGNKPVPKARLEVASFGAGIETEAFNTDENGRFWIKPEFKGKTNPTIIISTKKKNDFSRVRLTLFDKELDLRDSIVQTFYPELKPFVEQYKVEEYEAKENLDTLFKIWETKYLNEVTVTAKKGGEFERSIERYQTGRVSALTQADFGENILDMESLIQLLGFGLYVEGDDILSTSGAESVGAKVILDGVDQRDLGFSAISHLNSTMIEGIAYAKGAMVGAEYNSKGAAVLIVTTLPGKNAPVEKKEIKNLFTSKRYGKVLSFYSPKYETPEQRHSPIPDSRITLLWKNNLKTDSLGNANVTFYTGDKKGTFLINIQGISQKNGPIFKQIPIEVH